MKADFPFTDYDFWAFLTCGFFLLLSADFIFELNWLPAKDWTIYQGILVVGGSYVAGHMIAGLSSAFLERTVLNKCIGEPTSYLLRKKSGTSFFSRLFPHYFSPLPTEIASAIVEVNRKTGLVTPDAIFVGGFVKSRSNDVVQKRLSSFLNQYGMCRNLSFVFLVLVSLFLVRWMQTGENALVGASFLCLLGSYAFFLRFLKYYRQYTREVLLCHL